MEPLKPQKKAQILSENPHIDPHDLEEYERLLATRLAIDAENEPAAAREAEAELAALSKKLFPKKDADGGP